MGVNSGKFYDAKKIQALIISSCLILMLGCDKPTEPVDKKQIEHTNTKLNIAETFEDPIFQEYLSENYDENEDGYLSEVEISRVTTIKISGVADENYQKLTSLSGIEHFTGLTDLKCYNCELTGIDISQNVKLERVSLGYTKLQKLDVSKNPNLLVLNCSGTEISELDISNNKYIENLSIDETDIDEIDVADLENLKSFSCPPKIKKLI